MMDEWSKSFTPQLIHDWDGCYGDLFTNLSLSGGGDCESAIGRWGLGNDLSRGPASHKIKRSRHTGQSHGIHALVRQGYQSRRDHSLLNQDEVYDYGEQMANILYDERWVKPAGEEEARRQGEEARRQGRRSFQRRDGLDLLVEALCRA